MTLTIAIPEELESALRGQFGANLEQSAKEELAAAWFSAGKLSSRQVAQLLGLSLFEAHAFLKSHHASLPMTEQEVASDVATLRKLTKP